METAIVESVNEIVDKSTYRSIITRNFVEKKWEKLLKRTEN